ncbi:Mitotic spindle assembly checkpoint protein MAD1 [Araneus ventricosus]|uniref:Mitotic spindle assembly checkpoint protein MAD1 n=1 Tax=Araneus ventricosus TaxID=182803 RepID=A0A4Y2P7I6_ARAVE|nr:Mitotic spindle assembly checkpoint protein MAD1 [Araneus ventricosus]
MYNLKQRRGLSPKLQQNWEGPYTVVEKLNDVVYRVQRSPNAKPKVIHINRLAPYRTTDHNSVEFTAALHNSLESLLEEFQLMLDSQKIEELQAKLKWAKKQVSSAKSQIYETERQKKIELDQQELRLLALQQENSNLKVEIADVKSEKTEAIRKLHMEIGSLELKVSMLSEETQKSQEYIQSLKKKNSEMAEAVALCNSYKEELKEAQAKIKALENKIEANKDAALIISSRQNDLKSLNELQKENRILKEEVAKYKESNVMLYQEKMWSLQEKLSQAERKCVAVAKLQVENEQLKAKISQWEELFDDKSSPYKSPTAFSRKLSQYQQNEAVLTNKLSHLTSHCETLEKQIRDKDEIIKSLNHKLEQAQLNTSRMESVVKRFQRKILFLSKEKDNCRKLLDSYLSEATISGVALNAVQISHLEEMNADYKKALEKVFILFQKVIIARHSKIYIANISICIELHISTYGDTPNLHDERLMKSVQGEFGKGEV